ncbi:hypothetical protein MTR_7g080260 [Medicago truncatula]|uniref:Transmembrane protein n=1 Tax=Medicago truncatula TaxID=3880 RepID=G7KRK2_MEDTR|nr:hypothetical protein MTR_7g080260 [Medicago truncatula]
MAEIQIEIHPNPSRFIIWIRLLVICGHCGGGYGGRGGGGYGSGCKPVQGGGVVMAMVCSLSNFIFN